MILVVLITTLLVSCRADVSHLETDLQEDGYHYKKPSQPFPPQDNAGLAFDNQLQTDEQQQNSDELSPSTAGSFPSGSVKPILEYLPPTGHSAVSQSSPLPEEYGTPSTYKSPVKTQPAVEYGSPTVSSTVAADAQGSQSPPGSSTYLSPSKYGSPTISSTFAADSQETQSPPGSSTYLSPSKYGSPTVSSTFAADSQETQSPAGSSTYLSPSKYGSPTISSTFAADSQGTQSPTGSSTYLSPSKPSFSSPIPKSSISDFPTRIENPASQTESVEPNRAYGAPPTATQGTKIPQPMFTSPPTAPEREYLPPIENEIKSEQEKTYPQPSPPIRYPSPLPTKPSPTNVKPQSPYPQLSDQSNPTTYQTSPQDSEETEYTSPKISSPKSYSEPQSTYPTGSGPQGVEPKPAHKLGPDGYEYKVPSKTFEY